MASKTRGFKLFLFFFLELCRVYLVSANDNSSNIKLNETRNCGLEYIKEIQYLQNLGMEYCDPLFDGIMCWGPVPVNSTQFQRCPLHILELSGLAMPWKDTIDKKPHPFRYAHRTCGDDGTWSMNKTDYLRCYQMPHDPFNQHVNIIYIVGNTISFVSLILAVSIFVYFKKLMCLRNKIHCHFFLAIILRIITFFFHCAFEKTTYNTTSNLLCYFLASMAHFSGLAKYLWMLAEGLYLVLVIIWTFGLERLKLWNFGLGSWGVSLVLTLIWLVVKNVRSSGCKDKTEDWFIYSFIILSLVINLGIAIFIARTLLTKLHDTQRLQRHVSRGSRVKEVHCPSTRSTRASYANAGDKPRSKERRRQLLAVASVHRKTMRSMLILFPLLGLTYIIFLWPPHASFKRPWSVINAIMSSTQGFFVALLFCFLNHEVQGAVRSAYRSWRDQRGFPRYAYGRSNSLFVEQNHIYRRQSSSPNQAKTDSTRRPASEV